MRAAMLEPLYRLCDTKARNAPDCLMDVLAASEAENRLHRQNYVAVMRHTLRQVGGYRMRQEAVQQACPANLVWEKARAPMAYDGIQEVSWRECRRLEALIKSNRATFADKRAVFRHRFDHTLLQGIRNCTTAERAFLFAACDTPANLAVLECAAETRGLHRADHAVQCFDAIFVQLVDPTKSLVHMIRDLLTSMGLQGGVDSDGEVDVDALDRVVLAPGRPPSEGRPSDRELCSREPSDRELCSREPSDRELCSREPLVATLSEAADRILLVAGIKPPPRTSERVRAVNRPSSLLMSKVGSVLTRFYGARLQVVEGSGVRTQKDGVRTTTGQRWSIKFNSEFSQMLKDKWAFRVSLNADRRTMDADLDDEEDSGAGTGADTGGGAAAGSGADTGDGPSDARRVEPEYEDVAAALNLGTREEGQGQDGVRRLTNAPPPPPQPVCSWSGRPGGPP
jgi:hypothetical protein